MTRYVQHISGQGRKWEIDKAVDANNDGMSYWVVYAETCTHRQPILPKSEYRLCDPPEKWVDVTAEFHATENWPSEIYSKSNAIADADGYVIWIPATQHNRARGLYLRKIDLNEKYAGRWAFVVEKKETP